jgi:adenylate cyclase
MYTDFEPENQVKQAYTLAVRHFLKYKRLTLWRNTMENIEIERKFLVKEIPDNLDTYERIDMTQGYLNTSPVVRVRKENDDYVLTYKGSGLLSHSEYNLPLNKESFDHLLKKCDGIIISKSRYKIPLKNNLTAELDIFKGDLESLKLVEVEFDSVEEANNFIPPEWFGEDVTTDNRYHNSYIAKYGLLKWRY